MTLETAALTEHPTPHFEEGTTVHSVKIDIDYAIVKHFSENLYSSPNKAIEELVANGFDALASRVYVYVPGDHVGDRVVVWDDGISMDAGGLEAMWHIAKSPKEDLGGDRVVTSGSRQRAVIGKFGIGKLASYAVGHRITHICRTTDGQHLTVSVDYRQFTSGAGGGGTPSPTGSSITIRQLESSDAERIVGDLLPTGDARSYMLSQPHWTMAIIEDLRSSKPLYPGRLAWILGNGMPLRPDFRVWVEDEEVLAKLAKDAATTWTLGDAPLTSALKVAWADAKKAGSVDGDLDFSPAALAPDGYEASEPGATDPAVTFPTLGRVTSTVRLFVDTLTSRKEEGRSHGFFLMVRGRLVNADDDKLLLHDPSFSTFYRSQFIIRSNALDAELLADRESLRRDTPMTRELQVLQASLYRAARAAIDSQDEVASKAAKAESRLPARSRELFRDPMAALFARAEVRPTSANLDEPAIDRVSLGEDHSLSELASSSGHLQVNLTHPFYQVVEQQAGGGKRGAAIMRAFDLFAVAEKLTEGFLYGRGMSDDSIHDLLDWRDRLLRSLAQGYGRNASDAILELRASSVEGDKRFENAIADLFRLLGFSATRDGASGQKDVVVVAPVGPGHRVFIVEAKGSGGKVENVPAAVASAAAHRDKVSGAKHALIVAREFAGFDKKDEPAILEECRATKNVSLVTVEALVNLYEALLKYAYPLDTIMDALFVLEAPSAKLARIAELEKPLHDFSFREVLEGIWSGQAGEAIEDLVAIRSLWQSNPGWRRNLALDEFRNKLVALSHFAGKLMVLDLTEDAVHITQHPDIVVEHVERALHPSTTNEGIAAEGQAGVGAQPS